MDVSEAAINIRFPCRFTLEWKTANNRTSVASAEGKVSVNSKVEFGEKLTFITEVLHDEKANWASKKDTLFMVNLTSNSKPDQVKLVGRIIIDLA